jgi:hypothetical protein
LGLDRATRARDGAARATHGEDSLAGQPGRASGMARLEGRKLTWVDYHRATRATRAAQLGSPGRATRAIRAAPSRSRPCACLRQQQMDRGPHGMWTPSRERGMAGVGLRVNRAGPPGPGARAVRLAGTSIARGRARAIITSTDRSLRSATGLGLTTRREKTAIIVDSEDLKCLRRSRHDRDSILVKGFFWPWLAVGRGEQPGVLARVPQAWQTPPRTPSRGDAMMCLLRILLMHAFDHPITAPRVAVTVGAAHARSPPLSGGSAAMPRNTSDYGSDMTPGYMGGYYIRLKHLRCIISIKTGLYHLFQITSIISLFNSTFIIPIILFRCY